MKSYLFLAAAIVCETLGTSFLKASEQFRNPAPTIIFIVSMGCSFYLLSFALKGIPIGLAYAIWSATGIVLISIIGVVAFRQRLDLPAILGIVLIIAGVIIIRLFSKATTH